MVHLQVVMIFIANNYLMIRHFTLLDFCINPSHEVTLAETYTREGFMQKPQMIWNLLHHICGICIVMIFIANYKAMSRHLLFSTFA